MSSNRERSEIGEETFGRYNAWLSEGDGILFGNMDKGVFVQLADNDRISVLDVSDSRMTLFETAPLVEGEPYGRDFDGGPITVEGRNRENNRRKIIVEAPKAIGKKVVRLKHAARSLAQTA